MPGICQPGRGRRFGRRNSQGRCSALPFCASGQIQTGRSAYPRQRSGLLVDSNGRAHHLQHPRGSFGSAIGRARRYESPLCGEPSQCGYGVAGAFGQARRAPHSSTNEAGVRRPAFFPGVRRRLTAAHGLRTREQRSATLADFPLSIQPTAPFLCPSCRPFRNKSEATRQRCLSPRAKRITMRCRLRIRGYDETNPKGSGFRYDGGQSHHRICSGRCRNPLLVIVGKSALEIGLKLGRAASNEP